MCASFQSGPCAPPSRQAPYAPYAPRPSLQAPQGPPPQPRTPAPHPSPAGLRARPSALHSPTPALLPLVTLSCPSAATTGSVPSVTNQDGLARLLSLVPRRKTVNSTCSLGWPGKYLVFRILAPRAWARGCARQRPACGLCSVTRFPPSPGLALRSACPSLAV